MSNIGNSEPYPSDQFLVDQFHFTPQKDLFEAALANHDWFGFGDNHGTASFTGTTDDVAEGSVNFYFTDSRFDTRFALKDTDDLTEGSTNLYWTDLRFDTRFATKVLGDLNNVDETGAAEYSILKYDGSQWGVEQLLNQYVPISEVTSHDAPGEKGQWSVGSPSFQSDPNPSLWLCVAENTWLDCVDSESVDWIIDQFVADELPSLVETIVYAFSDDQYVPASQITDQDSSGKKGQWSYEGQYFYICISADTWARYAVETSFTK